MLTVRSWRRMGAVLLLASANVAASITVAPLGEAASSAGDETVQVALTLTGSAQPALAFAGAKGLHVDLVTRHTVLLSGPATKAAGAFGARLHRVRARGGWSGAARYLAPEATPRVPDALRETVGAVVGLDNRPLFEHFAYPSGYTGSDLSTAYDAGGLTGGGAGITVATVQFDSWFPSDATTYANAAGIPLGANQITTVQMPLSNTVPDGTGGDQEVALDVEALLATAPHAAQRVYIAPNNSAGAVAVYSKIADDVAAGRVQVVSSSWGGCEALYSGSLLHQMSAPINRIVANGATVFAASGDSGAYGCADAQNPDGELAVDFPASLPSVVGVGGTSLTSSSGIFAEIGWGAAPSTTASTTFPGRGSGGGTSAIFGRPAYQSSISASGSGRAVPDVSALADANSGFGAFSISAGGWHSFGGTSFGAPMWAGQIASALSTIGLTSGIGDIHAALYASAPTSFRDVTSGSNGFYGAGAGYDQVTGLGSPQWTALSVALGLSSSTSTSAMVKRVSGLNRVLTSVAVSKERFENAGQPDAASAVVLASSEGFADGVSGGPLAAAVNGPLLLTAGSSLDPATAAEISRILPAGGTVDVLGGVGAISANVTSSLTRLGFTVTRLWGADRFSTAVAVADSLPAVKTVLLTSGLVFPDALSAGPAAAHTGGVVLLTQGATLPSATKAYLDAHAGVEVFAVGGDAAKAAPGIPADHQLVGADRYATGTMVASHFFDQPASLTFASGQNFPDALSGGAYASLLDGPILLVSATAVPADVASYLRANLTSVTGSTLVGGTGVVTENVRTSLARTLNGF